MYLLGGTLLIYGKPKDLTIWLKAEYYNYIKSWTAVVLLSDERVTPNDQCKSDITTQMLHCGIIFYNYS